MPDEAGQLRDGGDGGEAARRVRGGVLAGGLGKGSCCRIGTQEVGYWQWAFRGVLVGLVITPAIFLLHGESVLTSIAWGIPAGALGGFLSSGYVWPTDLFRRRKRTRAKTHRHQP